MIKKRTTYNNDESRVEIYLSTGRGSFSTIKSITEDKKEADYANDTLREIKAQVARHIDNVGSVIVVPSVTTTEYCEFCNLEVDFDSKGYPSFCCDEYMDQCLELGIMKFCDHDNIYEYVGTPEEVLRALKNE
jgi:hypothetical protein